MSADIIVLYISICYSPDKPRLYKISQESLAKFDNNLENLFYDDNFREYAEELTDSFFGEVQYEQSWQLTPRYAIDRVFTTE